MQDAVNGGLQPQPWHHNIIQAGPYPIFPKIHPDLHMYYGYKNAPICPSTAYQGSKQFEYIQYGIGMHSMGVFSLNHDTKTSYRLGHTPVCFLKFTPTAPTSTCKDAPICPPTASQGAKHFIYIQYGCGMQSMGVGSLNHDTTTSYRLSHHTPVFI